VRLQRKNTPTTPINIKFKLTPNPLKKTNEVIILKAKIFVYSAIKIKANSPDPYSVLNPETNSDSPSARSNGVRLVSAKRVTNQTITRGESKIPLIIILLEYKVAIDAQKRRGLIRITPIETSYEIVCAILRILPNSAYLELETQPAKRIVYTFTLEILKK